MNIINERRKNEGNYKIQTQNPMVKTYAPIKLIRFCFASDFKTIGLS